MSKRDVDHFAAAMADVVPLAPDHRGRVRAGSAASPVPAVRSPQPQSQSRAQSRAARPGAGAPGSITSPAAAEEGIDVDAGYVAAGVDRRELRKIKRGDYVAGRVLDLHGLKADEAIASVKQLLDGGRHLHRCLCIVHGRGLHSKGNAAVLKARVRAYLRRHPAVLAYADAPRTNGGSGAVYVLLRR
jgi:DNA-nicking Smr family endonuclease